MQGSWFIYKRVMFHIYMSHAHEPCAMRSVYMYVYLDVSMSLSCCVGHESCCVSHGSCEPRSHNISHEIL